LLSAIAPDVGSVTHFIRRAQYVLPARFKPRGTEELKTIDDKYEEIWTQIFESGGGFGYDEPTKKFDESSPEERERVFEELYQLGSGFRFLFGGFSDLTLSETANQGAIDFIHRKIRETVKDKQVRR